MTAIVRTCRVLPRILLVVFLLMAWFAPPVYGTETTCETIENGYRCTVWVNTFGEGPTFTFEITEDQTAVNIITFTSDLTSPLPNEIFCFPSAVKPDALLFNVDVNSSISAISLTFDATSESERPLFFNGKAKFSYTVMVS